MILLILLLLTGCVSTSKYPDSCNVHQIDADGKGYTKGEFPCKLTHHTEGIK